MMPIAFFDTVDTKYGQMEALDIVMFKAEIRKDTNTDDTH